MSEEFPNPGVQVDFDEVWNDLKRSFPWTPENDVCDAIRAHDDDAARHLSRQMRGESMIESKYEAISRANPSILDFLLQLDDTIVEGLIVHACTQKDKECVRVLLKHGWPLSRPLFSATPVLCFFIDDLQFMRFLIEAGADPNTRSSMDESVLSFAIFRGDLEVVQFLLNLVDLMHGDLLHWAVQRPNHQEGAEIAEFLVLAGADVNAYRYNNPVAFRFRCLFGLETPLHLACKMKNISVARLLLQHGADPDRKFFKAGVMVSPTPREIAALSQCDELIALFAASQVPQGAAGETEPFVMSRSLSVDLSPRPLERL